MSKIVHLRIKGFASNDEVWDLVAKYVAKYTDDHDHLVCAYYMQANQLQPGMAPKSFSCTYETNRNLVVDDTFMDGTVHYRPGTATKTVTISFSVADTCRVTDSVGVDLTRPEYKDPGFKEATLAVFFGY